MAKSPKPPPSAPTGKRPRGRPPKPGGRIPQVEVQRAYRARLAASGKVVRVVDAAAVTRSPPDTVPDFDPETQGIYDREMVKDLFEKLRSVSLKLKLRDEEVARLTQRNAYLERELRLQEQHLTIALKDNITLKNQLGRR